MVLTAVVAYVPDVAVAARLLQRRRLAAVELLQLLPFVAQPVVVAQLAVVDGGVAVDVAGVVVLVAVAVGRAVAAACPD